MKKLDLENVRIYSNTKDDIVDALDLIGQKVYMSDDEDFRRYSERELVGVCCEKDPSSAKFPFKGENVREWTHWYSYFVVCKDAKFKEEEEKKLRPFKSTYEFTQETGCNIGDVITIRKLDKSFEESCIVNGFKLLDTGPSISHCVHIVLGSDEYSLEELLLCFEYCVNGDWHSFGIEE